ncbi:pentapeptide repeat-containing protein [Streptomyces sp. NPDC014746]|uniref:pentapeptide repeat-containing protein n=1 Tax=Streptomyces sp. NPDC014746 TaxID=3364904 RepID=UPI0036F71CB3
MSTLAALGSLAVIVFTWVSLSQVESEQALTREGQVTDRYNAAVENIGSDSMDVRLGGIYALQRIMEDSPRDQPSIVNVLSTYIRNHAKRLKPGTSPSVLEPTSDIQAALTALGTRNSTYDGTATVDLRSTNLIGADLRGADLRHADLRHVDLQVASLNRANLADANLISANLNLTSLAQANLTGADLTSATLFGAKLTGADLTSADLPTNLSGADLTDAKGQH